MSLHNFSKSGKLLKKILLTHKLTLWSESQVRYVVLSDFEPILNLGMYLGVPAVVIVGIRKRF